jgi:hypothetical protein
MEGSAAVPTIDAVRLLRIASGMTIQGFKCSISQFDLGTTFPFY